MSGRIERVLRKAALGFCFIAQFAQAGMTTPGQFSVSPTGAATYNIPIQVPPGVSGMEPKLSLSYNSQGGNGLLGLGWSLSGLSTIGRCPRTLAQDGVRGSVNFDSNDRFCLDGQRLVLTDGTYGAAASQYRTELDSFSRITTSGTSGTGPGYFVVQTKSGLTMEYGSLAAARMEGPSDGSVATWALNRVSDRNGNVFTVSYSKNPTTRELVPIQIDYSSNSSSPSQLLRMSNFFTKRGRIRSFRTSADYCSRPITG